MNNILLIRNVNNEPPGQNLICIERTSLGIQTDENKTNHVTCHAYPVTALLGVQLR